MSLVFVTFCKDEGQKDLISLKIEGQQIIFS